jgi:hypothetical protein
MTSAAVQADADVPAVAKAYDPIQMLRDYLKDHRDAPGYLSNYLINRLGDQIVWYDRKSAEYKRRWEKYRRAVIVLSAAIPFLVGLIDLSFNGVPNIYFNTALKIVVGLAGVLIAVLEGFNSMYKSQEFYINYRVTTAQLMQEFSYFVGQGGDYAGLEPEKAFSKLVGNAEVILANENNRWAEVSRQKEKAEMADHIQEALKKFLEEHPMVAAKPKPTEDTEEG